MPTGILIRRARFLIAALLCLLTRISIAEDWPQFRGVHRDGITTEPIALTEWPPGGPKQLWKAQLGQSSSSVSVVKGRLFTMGFAPDLDATGKPRKIDETNSIGRDTIWCFDAATGTVLWKHAYAVKCDPQYGGTYSTPTVADGRIFTCSRDGQVFCLSADSGQVVWQRNLVKDFAAPIPFYGFSDSPLVVGDRVILDCGGPQAAALALEAATGKTLWTWGRGDIHYASPLAFDNAGAPGVIVIAEYTLVALTADAGKELWRYGDKKLRGMNSCATPIVIGNKLAINGSWDGRRTTLLEFGPHLPAGPKVIWENRKLLNFVQAPVIVDGYLYGSHSTNLNSKGALFKCMSMESGEVLWERDGFGQSPVIAAGDKLIIAGDQGEIAIVQASPKGFKPLARAQIMAGKVAVNPVLSHGRLYCRNNAGDLVCLDVQKPR